MTHNIKKERQLLRLVRCQHTTYVSSASPGISGQNERCGNRATIFANLHGWNDELFAACDEHAVEMVNTSQIFHRVHDLDQLEHLRLEPLGEESA
jgi:hypothetical protein